MDKKTFRTKEAPINQNYERTPEESAEFDEVKVTEIGEEVDLAEQNRIQKEKDAQKIEDILEELKNEGIEKKLVGKNEPEKIELSEESKKVDKKEKGTSNILSSFFKKIKTNIQSYLELISELRDAYALRKPLKSIEEEIKEGERDSKEAHVKNYLGNGEIIEAVKKAQAKPFSRKLTSEEISFGFSNLTKDISSLEEETKERLQKEEKNLELALELQEYDKKIPSLFANGSRLVKNLKPSIEAKKELLEKLNSEAGKNEFQEKRIEDIKKIINYLHDHKIKVPKKYKGFKKLM